MFAGRLIEWHLFVFYYKQVFVAAATSHTAEISGLNQSLERATEELHQLKMQLRDKEGMHKSCSRLWRMNLQYELSFMTLL